MPSQRKRIGFLPRAEVQNIIEQISKENKLSQSKVTGILVDEALRSRGVLKGTLNHKFNKNVSNKFNSLIVDNNSFNNEEVTKDDNLYSDESYIKKEIQMINDFIEFKFFKNIMNQNKKNI